MYLRVDKFDSFNKTYAKALERCNNYGYYFYELIKTLSYNWHDGYTTSFFNNFEIEHKNFDLFMEDLYEVGKLFNMIYGNYEEYHDTLSIDEDMYKAVEDQKTKLRDSYENLENMYLNINASTDAELDSMIRKNKDLINMSITRIDKKTDRIISTYNAINEKERVLSGHFAKIPSRKIDVIDFDNLLIVQSNSEVLGFTDMFDDVYRKVQYYIKDEYDIFNDLKKSFENTISVYKSRNSEKLNDMLVSLNNNLSAVHNNHENSLVFIDNRKLALSEVTEKARINIDNIGGV